MALRQAISEREGDPVSQVEVMTDFMEPMTEEDACEPVWPSSYGVRPVSGRRGFDSPLRFSFLFRKL